MREKAIKLTIITVCFNVENSIRETLESVLRQTYQEYEYIVIDGQSSDKTLEILDDYKDRITIYSERDFGIYNAMNRGIARAKGEFLYFLNSGDTLYAKDVLEKVVIQLNDKNTIYYGAVNAISCENVSRIKSFDDWDGTVEERLFEGWMPCHQGIFAPRDLLRTHYFRENFKLRADYEWLLYSVLNGAVCESLSLVIANYDLKGASSGLVHQNKLDEETTAIINEYQKDWLKLQGTGDEKWIAQVQYWREMSNKHLSMVKVFNKWQLLLQHNISVEKFFVEKEMSHVAIYGMGYIGERLFEELQSSNVVVDYVIDQRADVLQLAVPAYKPGDLLGKVDVVVVTALKDFEVIKGVLEAKLSIPIVSAEAVVEYCVTKVM